MRLRECFIHSKIRRNLSSVWCYWSEEKCKAGQKWNWTSIRRECGGLQDLHIREPRAVTNQSAVRGAKPGVKEHLGSRSEEQRAVTGAQRSNRGVRELMASIKHEWDWMHRNNLMLPHDSAFSCGSKSWCLSESVMMFQWQCDCASKNRSIDRSTASVLHFTPRRGRILLYVLHNLYFNHLILLPCLNMCVFFMSRIIRKLRGNKHCRSQMSHSIWWGLTSKSATTGAVCRAGSFPTFSQKVNIKRQI